MSRPLLLRALGLFLAAFALYALTAQRGLGWGDSGEFQYRVLTLGAEGVLRGCDSFATAHPLYVAVCKLVASTPFQVTLVSAFFGALAVALFFLLSRNLALAALLALSHGLWWLSTVSEVYTMSLCFFAAELLALRRFRATGSLGSLCALAALNGLHLEVHNLALLALPVYAWVSIGGARSRRTPGLAVPVWLLTASFWLWSFVTLGPRDVLFGSYGAQVLTLKPILPAAIPLNYLLGALSLAVPALVVAWRLWKGARRETGDLTVLFAIHFLFWATYFIVSQYTFILPSLFLAYLIAASFLRGRSSPKGACPRLVWAALFALQLFLPLAAWGVLSAVGFPPDYRALHPGRNDAAYFALPWHFTDDTASRAAAFRRTPWTGYPQEN